MSVDYVPCTFARPAGSRPDLAILYVAENHKLAGETVICTLAKSQQWITQLEEGQVVLVRDRLRKGKDKDYLGDALANNRQPLYSKKSEAVVQTKIELKEPDDSTDSELTSGFRRIDTYLELPKDIKIFEALASRCNNKEAAHLLLSYGISCLPHKAQSMSGEDLYSLLF